MKKLSVIILLLSALGGKAVAQDQTDLYSPDTKAQLVAKQFSFTEGPAVDKKGNVFFTDQPNNKIWEYDVNGKLSLFMDSAGRSNGTYFDSKGNLISCADEHDQLWSISPDKKVTVLITNYQGKLMDGPNDVWVDAKGGIFMTDPYCQRDYWKRKKPDLPAPNVYYLPKGSHDPVMVADSFKFPNGIVGTPDGKYLYVADLGLRKTFRFTIGKNGKLTDRTKVIDQGSDGMTLDEKGNIYLTGNGVTIYDPSGKKIGHIAINEPWTANLCFGGKKKDVLFITASTAIYIMKMNVKGVE